MSTGQSPLSDVNESETTSGDATRSSGPDQLGDTSPVTLWTCLLFFVGHRGAIERIANAPAATWLAFSWVMLAALFRDYDQADLLRAPGWLVVPLLASTSLVVLLFILLQCLTEVATFPLPKPTQFRRLLTCFWMTAPMAMIYAIPVERFCSEADATRWNLAFLALVATWRVLLLARIISVLYRFSFLRAIWPVMLLADTLVIIAMIALPFPLLNLMGGIDTPESIQIINEARLNVFFLGVMTWLFWLIGFSLSALHPSKPLPLTSPSTTPVDVRRGPWIVFGVSLAAMLIACFFTQPEQQKAEKFRRLLLAGQPAQGIEFISQYTRSDLPPHWDAPPRLDYDAFSPNLFPILSAIATTPKTAPWVRDLYAEKLLYFKRKMQGWGQFWSGLSAQDVTDLITFLKSSPEILEKFEDATGSEWGDSVTIRCVVAELIEYKLILPGSSEPLPLELVRQLLDLDQERNERHCGTKEAIAAKLEAFRQPVAQEDNSLGPEQEDLSPLENTP